jgi:hypothetical protein
MKTNTAVSMQFSSFCFYIKMAQQPCGSNISFYKLGKLSDTAFENLMTNMKTWLSMVAQG